MSEYEVVEVTDPSQWEGYLKKNYEIHFEGKKAHTLPNKKSAELFCELLNKSLVKLDAECKDSIVCWLQERLRNLEILKKSYSESKFIEFKNSILSGLEFFKSLE